MFTAETLLALSLFAFVASITPGPNNIMLLASGVNFGMRRSLPHMFGVNIGFAVMILLIGLGFGAVFQRFPWLHVALKLVGVAYMVWLASKIARSTGVGETERRARPMTFVQAAAFQWVNPKAWAMAVSAIAAYTLPGHLVASALVIAGVFGVVNLPSIACWALFGLGMRRYLSRPATIRRFNLAMAALLVASLVPAVAELAALL
jgi:threonine/homoserine/homoserine lactone efflux protein